VVPELEVELDVLELVAPPAPELVEEVALLDDAAPPPIPELVELVVVELVVALVVELVVEELALDDAWQMPCTHDPPGPAGGAQSMSAKHCTLQ
jgi:hypothetical protein